MTPSQLFGRRLRLTSLLALMFFASGCNNKPAAPPTPPPPVVTVIKPVLYGVQKYHQYNGYLESIENVEVKARVKGYLEEVHFTEGAEVDKNAKLYTIDPREYEAGVAKAESDIERARADIANAEAQIKLAEAEERRLRSLGTAAAETELDKAIATLAANRALLKTAIADENAGKAALRTAKLQLEFTDIRAPIGGVINRTLVTKGNLVGQESPTLLTTIVRMDKLYVYYDAAERDLVEYLQEASRSKNTSEEIKKLPIEVGVTSERGFPHTGTIDFRENRVDTGTGTVRVRGVLENGFGPDGKTRLLYPGLYAKIRVPIGPKVQLPVIPEEALLTGQEGRYVYVIGENNTVRKQTVQVLDQNVWKAPPPNGPETPESKVWSLSPPANPPATPPPGSGVAPGGPSLKPVQLQSIVAIKEGLSANDQIIVNGLQKARPGAPVSPELRELIPPKENP